MLYSELCTCKVVMRETTGGRAGTQPAACSSPSHSPHREGKEKRKLASARGQNFLNITSCIAALCKHSWSLCNNFPTIATVHSNATAFSFRPYTACARPMTKGNCTLKCIQLCVLIFLSWHIFTKKSSPDLIVTLQRDQTEQRTYMFVVHTLERFELLLHCPVISYDLKRNAEISQIYCSCLTERLQRQREKCFF